MTRGLSFLASHFNRTVELPSKATVRGDRWTTIPITWRNRRTGLANLKIGEMGSGYFFMVAYVWLEKYFSRGDYRKAKQTLKTEKLNLEL
jgi:dolichol-phosphate mannosyltransferase